MRNSFLLPIPELEIAAGLLNKAADAILQQDFTLARTLIVEADLKEIGEFTDQIIGAINPDIHGQTSMPRKLAAEKVKSRMPSPNQQNHIFERDGWRCRYCGCKVVSKFARHRMSQLFPDEARWGRTNAEKHYALATLLASADHILPHSRGGNNAVDNLVTACTPCQFGRGHWTIEEVGFTDPRTREPVIDSWDGLSRVLSF
jgi:5-methylcytosine-specific restriction endonuclease McrA